MAGVKFRQLIGLDVGTSALKGVLVDEKGNLLSAASQSYELATPEDGWTEQNPEDWLAAAISVLGMLAASDACRADRVSGIGLSGQMHGTVFLDRSGRVIRPAILWNDQRTEKECREIEQAFGGVEPLIRATGNLALTGFSAPKLLWLRKHEPANWAKVNKVLLPKDYVRYRLTGEMAAEVSDGSGTLLMDVSGRCWSNETLAKLDLDRSLFADLHESHEVVGELTAEVAKKTGLPKGTPVVAGAGDQAAGALGTGNVQPGTITVALGTSGVVFASSDRYLADPRGRLHAFCHAAPSVWHTMGVMLSAGGSFAWLSKILGLSFDEMVTEADKAPAGAGGLIFHPYLTGERTPLNDPTAKGLFFGLNIRHGRGHMIRAVMEGVIHGILDCYNLMREIDTPVKRVILTGGAARADLWCRMLADGLGNEIHTVKIDEGPAMGAALLAGVGTGLFASAGQACDNMVTCDKRYEPDRTNHRVFVENHEKYVYLQGAMRPIY